MKINRQRKIIELINKYDIDTQQELAQRLMDEGFEVTQATVSRDIRELNLTKIAVDGNKQKYDIPASTMTSLSAEYMGVLKDGIVSIEDAGNIIVIKTISGMAMAVGAALDAVNHEEIIGTIAGDDTLMCVVKNANNCQSVKEYLENLGELILLQ